MWKGDKLDYHTGFPENKGVAESRDPLNPKTRAWQGNISRGRGISRLRFAGIFSCWEGRHKTKDSPPPTKIRIDTNHHLQDPHCNAPMPPAKNAADDEPHASPLIQLLKAVKVAHEMEETGPGRRFTQRGTSDSHRLVAHDDVLVQSWRKPHRSLHILKAVEVAEEIEEAAPGRRSTRYGTSDSQRLVARDHAILNIHRSVELPEGAVECGTFDKSAMPCQGFRIFGGSSTASAQMGNEEG